MNSHYKRVYDPTQTPMTASRKLRNNWRYFRFTYLGFLPSMNTVGIVLFFMLAASWVVILPFTTLFWAVVIWLLMNK